MTTLRFSIFNRNVQIECQDDTLQQLIVSNFSHLQTPHLSTIDLHYNIAGSAEDGFLLQRGDYCQKISKGRGQVLFALEKDLVVELQKCCPHLYFVHSGVLELDGRACMLAAPSGSGKSTTTWALLHHGFHYMSDELAAIDLQTLTVHPYPHALNLKTEPPAPYRLPVGTCATSYAHLVPVTELPSACCDTPMPLVAIFFVTYSAATSGATIHSISSAEGTTSLYANTLNALAHPSAGLDAAVKIASQSACFKLLVEDLTTACQLVKNTLTKL